MSWRRRPIRDLNNSEQFRSDAIRGRPGCAVEHLRVDVHRRVDLGVSHDLRDLTLAKTRSRPILGLGVIHMTQAAWVTVPTSVSAVDSTHPLHREPVGQSRGISKP
jgi:hypothetical protein